MFKDHYPVTRKLPAEILTCDPSNKTVEVLTQAGVLRVSVYTTPTFFRWPKSGENWIVKQENGSWYLDSILQNENDIIRLRNLSPGDALINVAGKLLTNQNTKVTQKYTEILGREVWNSEKEYSIGETIQYEGKAYEAVEANKNVNPTTVSKSGGEKITTMVEGLEEGATETEMVEVEYETEEVVEYWKEIPNGNKIFVINHNLNDFAVQIAAIQLNVPHNEVKIAKRESYIANSIIVEFESNLEPFSTEIIVIG